MRLVTKKGLTVKANDKNRAVGAANPTFDATYTGLTNGDTSTTIGLTVSFACTANTGSAAGTYPITPSGAASTTNYTVTYVAGSLTVNALAVTVQAVELYVPVLPERLNPCDAPSP